MYTQCPSCHTVFRLTAAQLHAAAGTVRCGLCGSVFPAADRLLQQLPVYLQLAVPEGGTRTAAPRRPLAVATDLDAAYYGAAPAAGARRRRGSDWLWGGGSVLALLALMAQYAYFLRADLVHYPQLRPVIVQLCAALHCGLPPRRDLTQIAVLNRQVYEDPAAPGALLVTAAIENRAAFPQPYPTLQLSLSAIDGKVLALGRFTPRQYLTDAGGAGLMAPHQAAHLKLEIADPGQNATSFEFSFL